MKKFCLVLGLLAALLDAGCSTQNNRCVSWVGQYWATEKAWRSRKWMYDGVPCESSFRAGFKAGYRSARCGYDACDPPGPHHFWSAGGMTERDQQEAQAWCDGFSHGSMAAVQEQVTGVSQLDAETAQPPEGVPDVNYYSGIPSIGSIGSFSNGGQFPQAGQIMPGAVPYSSEAVPSNSPAMSGASPPIAPGGDGFPLPAPPAEPNQLSPSGGAGRVPYSPAIGGIGSLRSMIRPESNSSQQSTLPPQPSAQMTPPIGAPASLSAAASGVARPISLPAQDSSPRITPMSLAPPTGTPQVNPAMAPAPISRPAPQPQWEMPIIRD